MREQDREQMEHSYPLKDVEGELNVNLQEIDERAQSLRDDGIDPIPAWLQAVNEAADQLGESES